MAILTPRFILIEDQSLATDYRENSFVGYLTALPVNVWDRPLLNFLYPWPKPTQKQELGKPSLSLCTIEAILLHHNIASEQIIFPHPRLIQDNHFQFRSKDIILLSTMDPLGLGPATSSWQYFQHGIPFHSQAFWELFLKIRRLKQQFEFKLIIGGSGAWQLEHLQSIGKLGADVLFIGEAEKQLPEIIDEILQSSKIDEDHRIIHAHYIPESAFLPISHPSNLQMLEISRGCGRMCEFCVPTTSGKIRYVPESVIYASTQSLIDHGLYSVCLQSEDTLRYGSKNFEIDEDSILALYSNIFQQGMKRIFLTHATLVHFAHQPDTIGRLSTLLHEHGHRYYSVQPGIESGSERIMRQLMGGKFLPRSDLSWHEIVLEAFKVMQQNRWVPIASVIVGLPQEEREDILATEQLIDELINRSYFFLFAPLLFVPVPTTPLEASLRPKLSTLNADQTRVFKKMWKYNTRTIVDLWNIPNLRGYEFPHWKARMLKGMLTLGRIILK